jgi:hypothetical protein
LKTKENYDKIPIERWGGSIMAAGYSKTPLVQKLGIKQGFRVCVINPPANYWELVGELPDQVSVHELDEGDLDFIHFFTRERAQLEESLGVLKGKMVPTGMVWVSWPKKAAGVPTDVDENIVRDVALRSGLVDTKVAAMDETWSGLKLVIRLKDR